jgi:hypothetical protein
LDSKDPVPLNKDFDFIDQTGEISSKNYLIFVGRATWCQADVLAPGMFNVGFKIVNMAPSDYDIFLKMCNTYGM